MEKDDKPVRGKGVHRARNPNLTDDKTIRELDLIRIELGRVGVHFALTESKIPPEYRLEYRKNVRAYGKALDRLQTLLLKLVELRLEIGAMNDLRMQEAQKKLRKFVSQLQKGEYQTTSDVIEDFVKLVEPSISMIHDMTKIRGKVDSVIVRELLPLAGSESLTAEEDKDLEEALGEIRKGKAHVFSNAEEAVRFLKS